MEILPQGGIRGLPWRLLFSLELATNTGRRKSSVITLVYTVLCKRLLLIFKIISFPSLLSTSTVWGWSTSSLCSWRNFLTQLQENAASFVRGNSTLSSLMSYCFRNAVYQSGLESACNGEIHVLTRAATWLSPQNFRFVPSLHQMLRIGRDCCRILPKTGWWRIGPLYFYELELSLGT